MQWFPVQVHGKEHGSHYTQSRPLPATFTSSNDALVLFSCRSASPAIIEWMGYSLEESVSPANATATHPSVTFMEFAL